MKTVTKLLVFAALSILSVNSYAALITFNLPETGVTGLTTHTVTEGGTSLTIDNPNGNSLFGDNTFGFILDGLFIDGGLAPNLDFTFSENVRLVSFIIANTDVGESFDLVQGGLSSLNQSVSSLGVVSFTNTASTFLANQAISSAHSGHSSEGYSISSITVDTVSAVPESGNSLAFLGLGLAGVVFLRRLKVV